ncbi:hypothetical protein AGMMS49521_0190 [Campylobacterota bacterium]|nr:hypothetical protein AGMMS49521_0190 [Campylobacterota bacterium]
MRIHIGDDASVISLIDCDRYVSFVSGDWTSDDLAKHLVAQMNRQSMPYLGNGLRN